MGISYALSLVDFGTSSRVVHEEKKSKGFVWHEGLLLYSKEEMSGFISFCLFLCVFEIGSLYRNARLYLFLLFLAHQSFLNFEKALFEDEEQVLRTLETEYNSVPQEAR